jgi:hypothetical protein
MTMYLLRLLSPFRTSLLEARLNLLPYLSEPARMVYLLAQYHRSQLKCSLTRGEPRMFLIGAGGRVKRDDKQRLPLLPVDQNLLASGRHMNKSNL